MSTSAPPSSTAVSTTDPIAKIINERNYMRTVQKALRNSAWGQDLDAQTFQSVILWAERHGIDAATEITMLGGNIYLEADFYLRQLAKQVGEGNIEYAYPDHVHEDARLKVLMTDELAPPEYRDRAKAEYYRRVEERARYNLKDEAHAACVYHVRVKGMSQDFVGAKSVGNVRGKTSAGKWKDPVGEENPVETCESRSARRACRQFIDSFPSLKADMDRIETEAKLISIEVVKMRAKQLGTRGVAALKSGSEYEPTAEVEEDPIADAAAVDPPPAKAQIKAPEPTISEEQRKSLYARIEPKDVRQITTLGDHAALHALLRRVRGVGDDVEVHIRADEITETEFATMQDTIEALPDLPAGVSK